MFALYYSQILYLELFTRFSLPLNIKRVSMASEGTPRKRRTELSSITSESTNNPRGFRSFSTFGDGACGEPLLPQHLVVDFTPVEELDVDFIQRKCCAFWEFVNSRPELRGLMVFPNSNSYKVSETRSTLSDAAKSGTDDEDTISLTNDRTAISMLEFVEGKGLIDRIFEAKIPQSMCSLGSREYHERDPVITLGTASSITTKDTERKCHGACTSRSKKQKSDSPSIHSSPEVKNLCKNMEVWDIEHPKIMEPPGHPPALTHSILQRKIVT